MIFLNLLIIGFMILGSLLILIASVGIVLMEDLFIRMSASTKAATSGIACLLLAAFLHFVYQDGVWNLWVFVPTFFTTVFLIVTAPVGAHIIGRDAYMKKQVQLRKNTIDEFHTYRLNNPEEFKEN